MNEAFRKKRGATDVLSFPAQRQQRAERENLAANVTPQRGRAKPLRPAESSDRKYLGDIAISPTTARRNAAKYGRTLDAELRILMLHGVLHLVGYDHETDRGEMNRLEAKLRRRFGLA